MRKVILMITLSVDGFIADENGSVDWLVQDSDYDFNKFLNSVSTVIMGNSTYEQILGFNCPWPYKGKESFVISHTEKEHNERVTYSADPINLIKDLKNQKGDNIWICGGARIANLLLEQGLIDEMHLFYQPFILGKGMGLFNQGSKFNLKLLESNKYSGNLIEVKWVVEKN